MLAVLYAVAAAAAVLVRGVEGGCVDGSYPKWTKTRLNTNDAIGLNYANTVSGDKFVATDLWTSKHSCMANGGVYAQMETCEDLGMQLCTLDQLLDPAVRSATMRTCSTKNVLKTFVWSSTPCMRATGQFSFWQVSPGGTAKAQCTAGINGEVGALCCAANRGGSCRQCPTNSVVREIYGFQFCDCAPGFVASDEDGQMTCVDQRPQSTACPADMYSTPPSVQGCNSFPSTTSFPENEAASCQVHVEYNYPGTGCPPRRREVSLNQEWAQSFCSSKGARLCSRDELSWSPLNVPDAVQCRSEDKIVWSGERCYRNDIGDEEAYWARDYSKKNGEEWECLKKSTSRLGRKLMGMRCCADADTQAPRCQGCGIGGTTSGPGQTSFDACQCDPSQMVDGECNPLGARPSNCEANMYTKTSTKPCRDLLLNNPEQWFKTRFRACAAFLDPSGACFPEATYEEAKATCDAMGARLCRWDELKNGQLAGQAKGRAAVGCRTPTTWTESRCCDESRGAQSCDATGGHTRISIRGMRDDMQCAADDTVGEFICCADVEPEPCGEPCPTGAVAPPGENDPDTCQCEDPAGYLLADGGCKVKKITGCKAGEYMGSSRDLKRLRLKRSKRYTEEGVGSWVLGAATQVPASAQCDGLAAKTFSEAEAICSAEGMRLCRNANELAAGLAPGNNDACSRVGNARMWTSATCAGGGHWTTNVANTAGDQCRTGTQAAAVACCADIKKNRCRKCDPGSSSAAGSFSREDCECDFGLNGAMANSNDLRCASE